MSVVGWGTRLPSGMRQNRCQEIESATSRDSGSHPCWWRNLRDINRR
jgi:hypothetical protein